MQFLHIAALGFALCLNTAAWVGAEEYPPEDHDARIIWFDNHPERREHWFENHPAAREEWFDAHHEHRWEWFQDHPDLREHWFRDHPEQHDEYLHWRANHPNR
jgi:hypothetical protein